MPARSKRVPPGLEWLSRHGLSPEEIAGLNPCVPGEFTFRNNYYVNAATPDVVYAGTEEGTLPLVAGRWYLIPGSITQRQSSLMQNPAPVSRARRLIR